MRSKLSNVDAYNKFAVYLSFIMFPIYFILGIFIIISPEYFKDFNVFFRVVLGGVFIAYAISRFYRTLMKMKEAKSEIKNETEEEN